MELYIQYWVFGKFARHWKHSEKQLDTLIAPWRYDWDSHLSAQRFVECKEIIRFMDDFTKKLPSVYIANILKLWDSLLNWPNMTVT